MPRRCFPLARAFALLLALAPSLLPAAPLQQATVTATVNEVKVTRTGDSDRPAASGERIAGEQGLRTGLQSRAELEFADRTLTRLGANTVFTFEGGTRDLQLQEGTMLLQVPKSAGGAKIRTAAVTAAITGTTILLEYTPDQNPPPGSKKKKRRGYIKVIVLEGTLRLYLNNRVGESVLLNAGQMLITTPDAVQLPSSVDVDITRLADTSLLVNNRFWPRDGARAAGTGRGVETPLIAAAAARQSQEKARGRLLETNLAILGRGTNVLIKPTDPLATLDTRFNAEPQQYVRNDAASPTPSPSPSASPSPSPTPSPTPSPSPSKTGAVIENSGSLVVTSGTTVITDPVIQRAGQPDQFGRIYRGRAADGPASSYLFTTSSPLDAAVPLNDAFFGRGPRGGAFPAAGVAVFKFAGDISFTGNPTFLTAGGAQDVAFVAGGNVFTGTTPFTLNVGALRGLLLASQNGSVTLGANVTVIGTDAALTLYARGPTNGSALLAATVNLPQGVVLLAAELDATISGNVTAADVSIRRALRDAFVSGTVNAATANFNAGRNVTLSGLANVQTLGLSAGPTDGTLTFGTANLGSSLTSLSAGGAGVVLPGGLTLGTGVTGLLLSTGAGGINASTDAITGPILSLSLNGTGPLVAGSVNVLSVVSNGAPINVASTLTTGSLNSSGPVSAPTINAGVFNVSGLVTTQSLTTGSTLTNPNFAPGLVSLTLGGLTYNGDLPVDRLTSTGAVSITGFLRPLGSLPFAQRTVSSGGDLNVGGGIGFAAVAAGPRYVSVSAGRDLLTSALLADGVTAGRDLRVNGTMIFRDATAGGAVVIGGDLSSLEDPATNPANAYSLTGGSIQVNGNVLFGNTVATASPPTLTLRSTAGGIALFGFVDLRSAAPSAAGGRLLIPQAAGDVTFGGASGATLNLSGNASTTSGQNGGDGGQFIATAAGTFTLNAPAFLNGGAALASDPATVRGGNGGIFSVSAGTIVLNGAIDVRQGDAPMGQPNAANGGAITLVSTAGDITINASLLYLKDGKGTILIDAARDLFVSQFSNTFGGIDPLMGTLRTGRDFVLTSVDQNITFRFGEVTVGRDLLGTETNNQFGIRLLATNLTVGRDLLLSAGPNGDPLRFVLTVETLDAGGRIENPGLLSYRTRVTAGGDITVGSAGTNSRLLFPNSSLSSVLTTPGAFTVLRSFGVQALSDPRSTATINAASVALGTAGYSNGGIVNLNSVGDLTRFYPAAALVVNAGSLTLGGPITGIGANGADPVFGFTPDGQDGGSVRFTLSGAGTFTLPADPAAGVFAATLTGGNGFTDGSAVFGRVGNGGEFSVSNGGNIVINGTIDVREGAAYAGQPNSPAGGTITLTSTGGDVTVNAQPLYFLNGNMATATISAARDALFNGTGGVLTIGGFINAGRDIVSSAGLEFQTAVAGRDVFVAANLSALRVTAGGNVSVGTNLDISFLTAGGSVSADLLRPNYIADVAAQDLPTIPLGSDNNVFTLTAGAGLNVRFLDYRTFNGVPSQLTIDLGTSTASITEGANFNAPTIFYDPGTGPDQIAAIAGSLTLSAGALVTGPNVTFTARGADVDSAVNRGTDGGRITFTLGSSLVMQTTATAYADVSGGGSTGGSGPAPIQGGSGGRFAVTLTAGDLTAASPLLASTGSSSESVFLPTNTGGTVFLAAQAGAVNLDSLIRVSDDGGQNRSGNGGQILVSSGRTSGPAITLGAGANLQAPISFTSASNGGVGGLISLTSAGGDIALGSATINVPFGTLTIRAGTAAAGGTVSLGSADIQASGVTIEAASLALGASGFPFAFGGNYVIGAGGITGAGNLGLTVGKGFGILDVISAGAVDVGGSILVRSLVTTTPGAGVTAGQNIGVSFFLDSAGSITAGGNITQTSDEVGFLRAAGDITTATGSNGGLSAPGDPWFIQAGGNILTKFITAGSVTAGGDITLTSDGSFGSLVANTVTAGGFVRLNEVPLVTPNNATASGSATDPGFTYVPFTLTAQGIASSGATIPSLEASGANFDADPSIPNPGNGGLVTLNLGSLTVGSGADLVQINSNGGAFGPASVAGGDGGSVTVNATNDVTVAATGVISATTGLISNGTPATAGAGGTVTINSGGTVDIAGRIEASSDEDPTATPPLPPRRISSRGGNISVRSTRAGTPAAPVVAVRIQSTAQLNSLLNAAAPGPGGKITIVATGASSKIQFDGRARADRGTIEVRHDGAAGSIATTSTADLRGDVVKLGALGPNGVLTIGGGILSADSTLKLYATGSNGQVVFSANTSLLGASVKYIAGQSVTINNGVAVNVAGPAAQVFTNVPNYTGSGGNNSTTGAFTGSGATTQPLGGQPGF